MNTTLADRQREQTGLEVPTHHNQGIPETKTMQLFPARSYHVCIRCGYSWEHGALIDLYCPTCGHKFYEFPPIRK